MRHFYIILISTTLLVSGCFQSFADEQEEMLIMASALTKLSSAVESTIRYKNPPSDATDDELLELSTQHDPGLLTPFEGYKIRLMDKDRHAVVLICTLDENQALLEDAGCSAELDAHHWDMPTLHECGFSLDMDKICAN